jgi:hypothetical protein
VSQEVQISEETSEEDNNNKAQSTNAIAKTAWKDPTKNFDPSASKCSTKSSTSIENYSNVLETEDAPNPEQIEMAEENAESEMSEPNSVNNESAEITQRKMEINAAILSLKTNLLLCAIFLFVFVFTFVLPQALSIIIITTLKGHIPVLTSVANFGKIQQIFTVYLDNQDLQMHYR